MSDEVITTRNGVVQIRYCGEVYYTDTYGSRVLNRNGLAVSRNLAKKVVAAYNAIQEIESNMNMMARFKSDEETVETATASAFSRMFNGAYFGQAGT